MSIMGFKTEINYILKTSDSNDYLEVDPGQTINIRKKGLRTYVMNASIMFADANWKILGMCVITGTNVQYNRCKPDESITEVTAIVVSRFTDQESETVSRLVLGAEEARIFLSV